MLGRSPWGGEVRRKEDLGAFYRGRGEQGREIISSESMALAINGEESRGETVGL